MNLRIAAIGLVGVATGAWFFHQEIGLPITFLTPQSSAAQTAPVAATKQTPTGEVLLHVTKLENGQSVELGQFDLAMLQAMPKASFETTTMWTEGTQRFEGVELKTFLDALNITEGVLSATAINDYRIEIPVNEIEPGGPMIAYARNDAPMSVRDKGPLWIVYPYDSDPKYQSEVVFSRSIWQLDRLEITP